MTYSLVLTDNLTNVKSIFTRNLSCWSNCCYTVSLAFYSTYHLQSHISFSTCDNNKLLVQQQVMIGCIICESTSLYICLHWPFCHTQIHLYKKNQYWKLYFCVCLLLWPLAICGCSTHLQCGRILYCPLCTSKHTPTLGCNDHCLNIWWTWWGKWVNHGVREQPKAQWENWYFLTHSNLLCAVPIPEINLLTVWNKPFRVYSLVCHGWKAKVDNGEQMGKPQHYYASGWNRLTGFRELVIWFWRAVTQWHFFLSAQQNSFLPVVGIDCTCSFFLFILGQSHLLA